MKRHRNPHLSRAREDAEGTELLESPDSDESIDVAREEAEGVEVFEDPHATTPVSLLKEGEPGRESLVTEIFEDREEWPDPEDQSTDH